MRERNFYQQRLVIVVYIAGIIVINVKFVKRVVEYIGTQWFNCSYFVCLDIKINVNNDKCEVNYITA
jgi:hypothetical protein